MHRLVSILAMPVVVALVVGCGGESTPQAQAPNATAAPATAIAPAHSLDQAVALHHQGVDGNTEAVKSSGKLLAEILQDDPDHALARAYAGSAELLLARDAAMPWNKQSHAVEGLTLLDEAVEMAPNDVAVRFVRGVATGHLPSAFGREDQSSQDIAWAAEQVRKQDGIAPDLAASVLYHHGRLLISSDPDAATAALRRAIQLAPESDAAERAAEALDELSGGA